MCSGFECKHQQKPKSLNNRCFLINGNYNYTKIASREKKKTSEKRQTEENEEINDTKMSCNSV